MKNKLLLVNLIISCTYICWLIYPAWLNSHIGIFTYTYLIFLSVSIFIISILQLIFCKKSSLKTLFIFTVLQILCSGVAFSLIGFDLNLYETLYSTFTPTFHIIFINYLMSYLIPIALVAINITLGVYQIRQSLKAKQRPSKKALS